MGVTKYGKRRPITVAFSFVPKAGLEPARL